MSGGRSVSVVIPCFNSLRYLPETVQTVLGQELPAGLVDDLEVVLVDDGGDDDLAGWVAQQGDDRLVLVVQPGNGGAAAARNAGIAAARGSLIAFVDADDRWHPSTLRLLVERLDAVPDAGMVYGWCRIVDPGGRPTGQVWRPSLEGEVWDELLLGNPISASAVLVPRAVLDEVGTFVERPAPGAVDVEDWDLWLRIAARHRLAVVPEVLSDYRRHPSSTSMDLDALESGYDRLFDRATRAGRPVAPAQLARARALGEIVLAWHAATDLGQAERAARHLRDARSLDPSIGRTPRYLRARGAVLLHRATGRWGFRAVRAVERAVRAARGRQPRP